MFKCLLVLHAKVAKEGDAQLAVHGDLGVQGLAELLQLANSFGNVLKPGGINLGNEHIVVIPLLFIQKLNFLDQVVDAFLDCLWGGLLAGELLVESEQGFVYLV